MKESRLRSALKALSWRFVATATIIVIAWLKTGDVTLALEIGAIEFIIKYLLYYLHERAWAGVPTGTIRKIFRFKKKKIVQNGEHRE